MDHFIEENNHIKNLDHSSWEPPMETGKPKETVKIFLAVLHKIPCPHFLWKVGPAKRFQPFFF